MQFVLECAVPVQSLSAFESVFFFFYNWLVKIWMSRLLQVLVNYSIYSSMHLRFLSDFSHSYQAKDSVNYLACQSLHVMLECTIVQENHGNGSFSCSVDMTSLGLICNNC